MVGSDLVIDMANKSLCRCHAVPQVVGQVCEPIGPAFHLSDVESQANRLLQSYQAELISPSLGSVKSLTIPLQIDTGKSRPVFEKARPLFGERCSQIEEELKKWIELK